MDPDLKDALDACIPKDNPIGEVPDVTDPNLRAHHLRMSKRMAQEGTLHLLNITYRDSFSFHPGHRAALQNTFNPIDPFLVFPGTTLGEGGRVLPVNQLDMIDTRTNMSVRETLRMLKVWLRHVIQRQH